MGVIKLRYVFFLKEVIDSILDIMNEAGYSDSEFSMKEYRIYGSQANGKATEESDLDILLEYEGTAREDDVFNTLHEHEIQLNGVVVDVNPIKAECSGTIEDYLSRCDDNWKESTSRRLRKAR